MCGDQPEGDPVDRTALIWRIPLSISASLQIASRSLKIEAVSRGYFPGRGLAKRSKALEKDKELLMRCPATTRSVLVLGLNWTLLAVVGVSPARAQFILPGAPMATPNPNPTTINLVESNDPTDPLVTALAPVPIFRGFAVLTEDGSLSDTDPKNWSDVLFFHLVTVNGVLRGEAELVSDPGENGITDMDLAVINATVQGIVADPNTQYRVEGQLFPPGTGIGREYIGVTGNDVLVYRVISEGAPEPSSFVLVAIGVGTGVGYWWVRGKPARRPSS
jgi:hypothetical protein